MSESLAGFTPDVETPPNSGEPLPNLLIQNRKSSIGESAFKEFCELNKALNESDSTRKNTRSFTFYAKY